MRGCCSLCVAAARSGMLVPRGCAHAIGVYVQGDKTTMARVAIRWVSPGMLCNVGFDWFFVFSDASSLANERPAPRYVSCIMPVANLGWCCRVADAVIVGASNLPYLRENLGA